MPLSLRLPLAVHELGAAAFQNFPPLFTGRGLFTLPIQASPKVVRTHASRRLSPLVMPSRKQPAAMKPTKKKDNAVQPARIHRIGEPSTRPTGSSSRSRPSASPAELLDVAESGDESDGGSYAPSYRGSSNSSRSSSRQ